MELKHSNPIIQSGDPYKYCYTGRKSVGQTLTEIINSTEFGCTISITGEWGTGKTTFLRMWEQDLKDNKYPTVLLNAWETEWAEDPLIAVVACIYRTCNKDSSKAIESINSILNAFVKRPIPMLGTVLKTMAEAKLGTDFSSISEELNSVSFDKEVESFNKRESALEELQTSLEKLAWDVNQGSDQQRPLIFIIDELDRCKPDYAVRLLEVLKHFFEVKNIVFVCAIDKKHLEDSIRGFYGCEGLNATEYLRRFFDLEIELPAPNFEKFCAHLYDYYKLGAFFDSKERVECGYRDDGEVFKRFLASLAEKSHLTLRQLERICAFTKMSLRKTNPRIYYYPTLSLFITYLRFFNHNFYLDLKNHTMSAQAVLDRIIAEYGTMIDNKPDYYNKSNNHRTMLFMIGKLVVAYVNDRSSEPEPIYDSEKKTTTLSCSIFSHEDLNEALGWASRGYDDYELSWLFSLLDILKIDSQ